MRIIPAFIFAIAELAWLQIGIAATPTESYKAQVHACMKPVWEKEMSWRVDRVPLGAVKVSFEITAQGKVENLRVTSNTGNEALAYVVIETIQLTRFPPIPKDVLEKLPDRRFSVQQSFSVVPP